MPETVSIAQSRQLVLTHLLVPGMVLFALVVFLNYTPLDFAFSRLFFDASGQTWPHRDEWLFRTLFHDWAQKLDVALLVLILGAFLHAKFIGKQRLRARAFSYLFFAAAAGPAIVGIFKNLTHIYCPWNLAIFGGDKPLIHLFDSVDPSLPVGHCFPGGHSGSGFALVSLYYFFLMLKPEYRFRGLFAGLLVGLLFSIVQEMRGAHMPSHDLTSLAICWSVATILYFLYESGRRERHSYQAGHPG